MFGIRYPTKRVGCRGLGTLASRNRGISCMHLKIGFRSFGFRFRVRVQGLGFRGLGFRVRVWGLGLCLAPACIASTQTLNAK